MSTGNNNPDLVFHLNHLSDSQFQFFSSLFPNSALTRESSYTTRNPRDPQYNALIGILNSQRVTNLQGGSATVHKDYSGPSELNAYIKYKIDPYPTNWDELLRIGQFLILSDNVATNDIIEWSRFFANLLVDQIDGDNITFLGNIPGIYSDTETTPLNQPNLPVGYTNDFNPTTSKWANSFSDIVTLDANSARYVLPIIFISVLRSQLGVQGKNYRRRLGVISKFVNIYTTGVYNIVVPPDHKFMILMQEDQNPTSVSNPKDRDFLAKLVKIRTGIDTANIGRIALGLITQNTTYYGLSHYQCYNRIVKKISLSESQNLLGAINQDAHTRELINFLQLISMATTFPDDDVWYCMRAIDLGYYFKYSPRQNPWVTLNLAYIEQKLIEDPNNFPYTNYISLQNGGYKSLGAARETFLDSWVNYWNLHSSIINSGSIAPPTDDQNMIQDVEIEELANEINFD